MDEGERTDETGEDATMLGRYSVAATEEAARALAASRSFDPARHDPAERCTIEIPCRYCRYDATAAVAAALLTIERLRGEEEAAVRRSSRVVDLAAQRAPAPARRSPRRG